MPDSFEGAKVAEIVSKYSVAVNRGSVNGVQKDMHIWIADRPIIDPDTDETLGFVEKLELKVVEVHERYCLAETISKPRPQTPLEQLFSMDQQLMRLTKPEPVTVNLGDLVFIKDSDE